MTRPSISRAIRAACAALLALLALLTLALKSLLELRYADELAAVHRF